jgi:hypothetical protein
VHDGHLRLTLSGTDISFTDAQLLARQREFRERHHLLLRGLVGPQLLSVLSTSLAHAEFAAADYEGVGHDLRLAPGGALNGLHLVMNDAAFLSTIERIVQASPLLTFWGRVYRMVPGQRHEADWHDDLFSDRHIGISINLSERPYDGGLFQIRRAGEEPLLGEVHNTGLGDAILFRLSPDLEHRVTPVTGKHPKTAFAGWFRPGPHPPAPLADLA